MDMITVGIATIPSRTASLEKVLDSLTEQVDKIYLALNGFYINDEPWYPLFLDKYSNVEYFHTHNERGDAEKFTMASIPDQIYLACDDDLLYPSGYAKMMVDAVTKHHCIITLHGKRYDGERPIASYRKSITSNMRCLNATFEDKEVHVGGTGCMGFSTNDFKISLDNFEQKNMADVIVAREAHKQGVKIMAIAHQPLAYLHPNDETIWQSTRDDSVQTAILNGFLK